MILTEDDDDDDDDDDDGDGDGDDDDDSLAELKQCLVFLGCIESL